MSPKAQEAFNKSRDAFDSAVERLSSEDYKEVIDEMACHIQCCSDCWDEENADR